MNKEELGRLDMIRGSLDGKDTAGVVVRQSERHHNIRSGMVLAERITIKLNIISRIF
ncbi:hypothetical protein Holit_02712 [Hollandina sp. SP2]